MANQSECRKQADTCDATDGCAHILRDREAPVAVLRAEDEAQGAAPHECQFKSNDCVPGDRSLVMLASHYNGHNDP